jgi:hypothetical protein
MGLHEVKLSMSLDPVKPHEADDGITKCKKTYSKSQLQQGVCHNVTLPFTLKSILRQRKNYENSNAKTKNPSRY